MEHHYFKQPLPGYDEEGNEIDEQMEEENAHPNHPDLPLPSGEFGEYKDIVLIEDQGKRVSELLCNAAQQSDELEEFHDYFKTLLVFPFEAIWRDPDEEKFECNVTVTGVIEEIEDTRRGIMFFAEIKTEDGNVRKRKIVAEQIYVAANSKQSQPHAQMSANPSDEETQSRREELAGMNVRLLKVQNSHAFVIRCASS
jgi:hypothetical protein